MHQRGEGNLVRPGEETLSDLDGVVARRVRAGAAAPAAEPVAPGWLPHHFGALERAAADLRVTAAKLSTPDDPYAGLMFSEDADTLDEIRKKLGDLPPPVPDEPHDGHRTE